MKPTRYLFTYAAGMLFLGLASIFYNAQTGAVGLNLNGKTGLIVCGIAAVLSALLGLLYSKGKGWALWAGLAVAALMLSVSGPKFFKGMREASRLQEAGEVAKVPVEQWRATLMGATAALSLAAFMRLFLAARKNQAAQP